MLVSEWIAALGKVLELAGDVQVKLHNQSTQDETVAHAVAFTLGSASEGTGNEARVLHAPASEQLQLDRAGSEDG